MTAPDRWEHGSEFHAPGRLPGAAAQDPWAGRGTFFGSARHALVALLAHGAGAAGWRRLWVPSYFCHEVVDALHLPAVELRGYPASPRGVEWPRGLGPGDVLLAVNFFGLASRAPEYAVGPGACVIEDHTHDPWSAWAMESRADWCVASLRKTLPIPDGAVAWSPAGAALPAPELSAGHATAALEKWAGMALKALYLQGAPLDKEAYRALLVSGETRMGSGAPSAISPVAAALLPAFPTGTLRDVRRRNVAALAAALEGVPGLEVLRPDSPAASPFCAVLVFDCGARREHVRAALIAARVYPAVLWPLEWAPPAPAPPEHVELSRRMLSVHCDARYGGDDIRRVALLVRRHAAEFSSRTEAAV